MNTVCRPISSAPRWRRAACVLATALLLTACGGGDAGSAPPAAEPVPALAQPFEAVGSSARTVSLAWTPPADAGEYAVERRSGSAGEFTRIATVQARSGAFMDSGLEAGTTYSYRLAVASGSRSETPAKAVTTTTEAAIVTPRGAVLGEFTGRTLGTAGGTLTSHDGQIVIELPAGALAADTATETQPVANTAPDGRGIGLKVRLAAAPRAPLTLKLRYDAAQDAEADGLRIAVQRPSGEWTSLPLAAIDKASRTLQAQLPVEFMASANAGAAAATANVTLEFHVVKYLAFFMAPREARVKVKQTVRLVPFARVRGWDTQIGTCLPNPDGTRSCFMQPMLEVRELPLTNTKAGFERAWWVDNALGGNAELGTVVADGAVGAIYTAPATVPAKPNVTVSIASLNLATGRAVNQAAFIEIWDDTWAGTMTAVDGPSSAGTTITSTAHVRWVQDLAASTATVKVYRGEGTVDVAVTDDDCTVTVTPTSQPISTNPLLVELRVDESTQPASYTARLITFWNATIFGQCPKGHATKDDRLAGWGWDVDGFVKPDGRTMEGRFVTEDGYLLDWTFKR